ncbi:hypothetical protein BLAT2472_30342 [Burkholderia latens]|nr:hypothetical protein BVI1335_1270040 [Burkholderia vietnamiensis]
MTRPISIILEHFEQANRISRAVPET